MAEQAFEIDRQSRVDTSVTALTPENWTGYDLIAFAKVIKKDNDAMIINAHKASEFTDISYNRVVTPGSGHAMIIYNVEDDTFDNKANFSSLQVGDFVYVELFENTLKNLVVYRP